jgi:hypothetical protein
MKNIRWIVIKDLLKAAWLVYRGKLMLNQISHSKIGLEISLLNWGHYKEKYTILEPHDYFCVKCGRLVMDRNNCDYCGWKCIEGETDKEYICEYCAYGVKPGSDDALMTLGHK